MKSFTIAAAVALLAPFVQGQDLITIFFESADHRATYSQSFPLDGSTQDINPPNSHSVSQLQSFNLVGKCTLYGSQGSVTNIVGYETVDVGPPQPQLKGSCTLL